MCGICGVVAREHTPLPDEATLVRVRDTMMHRGPDEAGIFVDHQVRLGHRRLSIVDLADGKQPMRSTDDRYVVVYNGEVFNHPTLKPELERAGVQYRTRSDTETVLHLFERFGDADPSKCGVSSRLPSGTDAIVLCGWHAIALA